MWYKDRGNQKQNTPFKDISTWSAFLEYGTRAKVSTTPYPLSYEFINELSIHSCGQTLCDLKGLFSEQYCTLDQVFDEWAFRETHKIQIITTINEQWHVALFDHVIWYQEKE